MRILHYSLGFPPARRGGMTTYCMDLMAEQRLHGHEVSLIWPGSLKGKNARCSVVERSHHQLPGGGFCGSYEILNPLPVPLVDGISDPSWQLVEKDATVFDRFFAKNSFEILHLHTVMGMPRELVQAALRNGVRVVFTTHDYFPICGKLVLFRDGDVCLDDECCRACCRCNAGGLSTVKMRILQSPLYGLMKEAKLARVLRSRHNEHVDDRQQAENGLINIENAPLYEALREANVALLNSLDAILYNSELTQGVYSRYGINNPKSWVLHVSNSGIADHRQLVTLDNRARLRLGYFGGPTSHKGRDLLVEACDLLWQGGIRGFELHTFGDYTVERDYSVAHPAFARDGLQGAMTFIDVAIIPSKCYETFGFIASEAMSFGRPVVISNRVGARDLVKDGENGRICEPTASSLSAVLADIVEHPEEVTRYSEYICSRSEFLTMAEHTADVERVYDVLLTTPACRVTRGE